MRVLCYAQTNIGSGRDNNEDNYYCNGTFKRDAAVPVAEAAAEQEGKRLIYGAVRETVTRMLRHFADDGVVSLGRGTVTVTDAQKLRSLAGM